MVGFSAANVLARKSVTGGAAGSSSAPQPLFYGVDTTAAAAVFSSVRDLTPTSTQPPPPGTGKCVCEEIGSSTYLCVCVCVCASSHLLSPYL